jgi:hypothetical protein
MKHRLFRYLVERKGFRVVRDREQLEGGRADERLRPDLQRHGRRRDQRAVPGLAERRLRRPGAMDVRVEPRPSDFEGSPDDVQIRHPAARARRAGRWPCCWSSSACRRATRGCRASGRVTRGSASHIRSVRSRRRFTTRPVSASKRSQSNSPPKADYFVTARAAERVPDHHAQKRGVAGAFADGALLPLLRIHGAPCARRVELRPAVRPENRTRHASGSSAGPTGSGRRGTGAPGRAA